MSNIVEQYSFRVISRGVDVNALCTPERIQIRVEVFKSSVSFCKMLITLGLDNSKEQKNIVQVIDLGASNPEMGYDEFMGYMTGYFEFTSRNGVFDAATDLRNTLNSNQENFEDFESKWNIFARQFTSWFNEKLRPCLAKELELHKMYFEER